MKKIFWIGCIITFVFFMLDVATHLFIFTVIGYIFLTILAFYSFFRKDDIIETKKEEDTKK